MKKEGRESLLLNSTENQDNSYQLSIIKQGRNKRSWQKLFFCFQQKVPFTLVQRGPSVATIAQLGGNLRIKKKNTNIFSEKLET